MEPWHPAEFHFAAPKLPDLRQKMSKFIHFCLSAGVGAGAAYYCHTDLLRLLNARSSAGKLLLEPKPKKASQKSEAVQRLESREDSIQQLEQQSIPSDGPGPELLVVDPVDPDEPALGKVALLMTAAVAAAGATLFSSGGLPPAFEVSSFCVVLLSTHAMSSAGLQSFHN